jgi:subtilase family serine protease
MKMNMKTVVTGALVIVAVLAFIAPAQAYYNWHGFPLNSTTANGSINGTINGGGVYVDYVNGGGTTANGNFTVPNGTDVEWAYLYFGIWGGCPCTKGWYNLTFNGTTYPTRFIGNNDTFECDTNSKGANDNHYYNWGSTCGKWWVAYNVTDNVTLGADNAVSVSTGGPQGCVPIDGRTYGIVLAVVYNNTSQSENYKYQYWIKAGNDAFCHEYDPDCVAGGTLPAHDSSTTYYNGTVDACNVTNADLTQVFLTAESESAYTLEFNGHGLDESVLTGGGYYFDFDTWDVTNYVESSGNDFYFHRGTGLYADDYVSLTVSALVLNVSDLGGGKPDLNVTDINVTPKFANITNTVNATIANVDSTNKSCAFTVKLYVNGSVNGTKTVPLLNPDTNTTLSFEWIPNSTGVYNITVVADSGGCITETDELNNTKTEFVTITDSPQPDLNVTAIYNDTVYDSGFTNTIIATIWNCDDDGWAGTFNVTLYNDSTPIGEKTVKVLGPGKKVNVTFDWKLDSGGYTTTLNATADSDNVVNETCETNNSLNKSVYVNSGKPPDLTVTDLPVPTISLNEDNTISATIKNKGGSNVTWSFNTTLYVNLVGETGSIVDNKTVTSLNKDTSTTVNYTWTPTVSGTYRLKVVADSDNEVFESAENETNNHLINWSSKLNVTLEVDNAKLYDNGNSGGTDATSEVNTSNDDDARVDVHRVNCPVGNVTLNFSGSTGTIHSVIFNYEHQEQSKLAIWLDVWNDDNSTWVKYDQSVNIGSDINSSCDITSTINTTAEANSASIRYVCQRNSAPGSPTSYGELDYANLTITYTPS